MHIARETARVAVPPLLAACVVALIVSDPGTRPDGSSAPAPGTLSVGR
ncbi:hypothetical protein [Longivirga aurantiaca]|uniref:Uncharacterized protein n=1 Tax=Longivirga aurantiaca TaxID=1837743 RepID=A0ABW1SX70_9ACTN